MDNHRSRVLIKLVLFTDIYPKNPTSQGEFWQSQKSGFDEEIVF
ncbi:MAG: hypothetical protein ACFCUV_14865 [Rivularia sp. (in: cyanobacteria)]